MAQIPLTLRSRADELRDKFLEFHRKNPQVWRLFVRYTFQLIDAGRKNYSARAVMHRIRWHTAVKTSEDFPEGFKINNNHTPHYARMFHEQYPEHDGFFRNRKLTSEEDVPKEWT